jgi:hypothetical protein
MEHDTINYHDDDQFMGCRSGGKSSRSRRDVIHASLAGLLVILKGRDFTTKEVFSGKGT